MSSNPNQNAQELIRQHGPVGLALGQRSQEYRLETHCLRYFLLINAARRDLARVFTREDIFYILSATQGVGELVYKRSMLYSVEDHIQYYGSSMEPPIAPNSAAAQTLCQKLQQHDSLHEIALVDAIEMFWVKDRSGDEYDPAKFFAAPSDPYALS